MTTLLERTQDSSGFIIFALKGLAGFLLGFIILAVGLWRARLASGWVTTLIVVSLVLEFIASNFIAYAGVVAGVLFASGLGWIGLKVLTMPDAEWGAPSGLKRDASVQRTAPVR